MSVGNYLFHGINEIEHQTRYDQFYTGVPGLGGGQALLVAPSGARAQEGLVSVEVQNPGTTQAIVRLRHGGGVKTVTDEILTSFLITGNQYAGSVQYRNLTPSSIVITEGNAQIVVDDGAGVLHDQGTPANVRGSVVYATGALSWTFGATAVAPVLVDYTHSDYEDFGFATSDSFTASGAGTEAFQLTYGRVNPGSLSISNDDLSVEDHADDGKGNIIQTPTTLAVVVGTINYATGAIALDNPPGTVLGTDADNTVVTYSVNPFAGVINPGGSSKLFDLFPTQLPELTAAPWSTGISGETEVALWAEATAASGDTHFVTKWGHFGETFTVRAIYSRVSPGGASNN